MSARPLLHHLASQAGGAPSTHYLVPEGSLARSTGLPILGALGHGSIHGWWMMGLMADGSLSTAGSPPRYLASLGATGLFSCSHTPYQKRLFAPISLPISSLQSPGLVLSWSCPFLSFPVLILSLSYPVSYCTLCVRLWCVCVYVCVCLLSVQSLCLCVWPSFCPTLPTRLLQSIHPHPLFI